MSATNYTLECEQGATFRCVVTWKDAEGNAINNSGYSGRMQVRKDSGTAPIAELNSETGGLDLGGSDGKVAINISAADTAGFIAGDYFYDLEVESEEGVVSRIMEGVFSVKREITK